MKKTWMITGTLLLVAVTTIMPTGADASSLISSDISDKQEVQWAPPPPKKQPTQEEIRESFKRNAERVRKYQEKTRREMEIATNPGGYEAMKRLYHDEGRARYEAEKNQRESVSRFVDLIFGKHHEPPVPPDDGYDYGYHRPSYGERPPMPPHGEAYAQRILDLCNRERSKVGAPPLRLSGPLQDGARIRAEELTRRFSHTRPDGRNCKTVLHDSNPYVGENIGAGYPTAEEAFQGWMKSFGHRKNILDPNFRELGVGFFYKPDTKYQYYWVQILRGTPRRTF